MTKPIRVEQINGALLMNMDTPILEFNGTLEFGGTHGLYYLTFDSVTIHNYIIAPIVVNKGFDEKVQREKLTKWFNKRLFSGRRALPHTDNIVFGEKYPNFFSLSDQYWIKYDGKDTNESWQNLSFFKRRADTTFGDYLFDENKYNRTAYIRGDCPEITTGGIQNKRWICNTKGEFSPTIGGVYYLHKRASKQIGTEVFNDVLVSNVLAKIGGIDFLNYKLVIDNYAFTSECRNMITPTQELVTATDLLSVIHRDNLESPYDALITAGKEFGIDGMENFLKSMSFVDELIHNDDRNTGNIAFIRDCLDGSFIKPAPLFDFGYAFLKANPADVKKNKFIAKRKELIRNNEIDKPDRELIQEEVSQFVREMSTEEVKKIQKLVSAREREDRDAVKFQ